MPDIIFHIDIRLTAVTFAAGARQRIAVRPRACQGSQEEEAELRTRWGRSRQRPARSSMLSKTLVGLAIVGLLVAACGQSTASTAPSAAASAAASAGVGRGVGRSDRPGDGRGIRIDRGVAGDRRRPPQQDPDLRGGRRHAAAREQLEPARRPGHPPGLELVRPVRGALLHEPQHGRADPVAGRELQDQRRLHGRHAQAPRRRHLVRRRASSPPMTSSTAWTF